MTKIQSTINPATTPSSVYISGNPVEVVESFVYLGSEIHSSGSSEPEVLRGIGLAKSCFNLLNRGIWRSSISVLTKVQLYRTYIQPVLLYGSEAWALTRALLDKLMLSAPYSPYTIHGSCSQRHGSISNWLTAAAVSADSEKMASTIRSRGKDGCVT